jgi:hypothetical protein
MKWKSICGMLKRFCDSWLPLLDIGVRSGDGDEAESIIRSITRIHAILVLEPDLRPCPHVNNLFEELVCLCTQNLSHTNVSRVRYPFTPNNSY